MDPKMPATLDPKLKEVYERVMGMPKPSPTSHPTPVSIPTTMPSAVKSAGFVAAPVAEPKKKTSPVFFILFGVIFFMGYAVFWIKFFKLSLPFLPF